MLASLELMLLTQFEFMNARSPLTQVDPELGSDGSEAMDGAVIGSVIEPEIPAGALNTSPPPVMLLKVNPIPASFVHGPASDAASYQVSAPPSFCRASQNDPALL